MRAVAQRVSGAEIRVVGVAVGDKPKQARWLADKLVHLRVFPDESGRMNRSVLDVGGSIGIVSQFTLLGNPRKGRRPSYNAAAPPEEAERLIEILVADVEGRGVAVTTGRFRAQMELELTNDGPVTLILDTGDDS